MVTLTRHRRGYSGPSPVTVRTGLTGRIRTGLTRPEQDFRPGCHRTNASSIVVMTQAALSSDHLLKKADTEELQWSPNLAGVLRVRGATAHGHACGVGGPETDRRLSHPERPDRRPANTRSSMRFLRRAYRDSAVLGGVPASLQRRAGDPRCQVRAKRPQRRLVAGTKQGDLPISSAQLRTDQ
jgi:hypothetical protein